VSNGTASEELGGQLQTVPKLREPMLKRQVIKLANLPTIKFNNKIVV